MQLLLATAALQPDGCNLSWLLLLLLVALGSAKPNPGKKSNKIHRHEKII
jgi:hypothetical protein